MGAEPWFYFTDYRSDISVALNELRQREFQSGRYYPAITSPSSAIFSNFPGRGPKHKSIEEAVAAASANGTRSILDIKRIANEPDSGAVCCLPQQRLIDLFGTEKPSQEMIMKNLIAGFKNGSDLFEKIDRGQGIYLIVYQNESPSKVFFAGYSYD